MIRNVVFDMGMVMLDYHPIEACRHFAPDEAAAQAIFEAIFASPEWIELDHGTISEEGVLAAACERLPGTLHAFAADVMAHWHEYGMSPNPGMDALVKELKRRGYRVYLLTNAGVRTRAYLHLVPCIELFDGVLISAEEKLLKPEAAIYLRLCEKFALVPQECFFVDDCRPNVDGARGVGFAAMQYDGDPDTVLPVLANAEAECD